MDELPTYETADKAFKDTIEGRPDSEDRIYTYNTILKWAVPFGVPIDLAEEWARREALNK